MQVSHLTLSFPVINLIEEWGKSSIVFQINIITLCLFKKKNHSGPGIGDRTSLNN
jgi:hypothetical protein